MTTTEHLSLTVDDAVAHVRLTRPDKLNGLTLPMLHGLREVAATIAADPSVRAVLLSGEGRSFCAGLDFASVLPDQQGMADGFAELPSLGTNAFQEACWAWRRLEVPVVAAVHGHCLGAGLQLALGADFRVTGPDAQWSVLEVKWGLIPDMTGARALAELVGIDTAKLLTMTGRFLTGEQAAQVGLATICADDPLAAAQELVAELLTRSPDALAAAKALFETTWGRSAPETFAVERAEQLRLLQLPNTTAAQQDGGTGQSPDFGPRAPR